MTNVTLGDVTECYGHGFCTAEDESKADSKFYCKCKHHFINETGSGKNKHPVNCSECKSKYSVTDGEIGRAHV